MTGRRLVAPVKDLGIEVDLAGPLDCAALGIYARLLEDLTPFIDQRENAPRGEQLAEIDVLHRAVAERRTNLMPLKRLDLGDVNDVAHRSGSIGSGFS
jgi:hypothetical protein